MRYSKFNQAEGLYDVWEDDQDFALNGPLPSPRPGPVIRGVAAASTQSGFKKPSKAQYVGKSWHAQGLIIPAAAGGGLGAFDEGSVLPVVLLAGGAAALYWLLS